MGVVIAWSFVLRYSSVTMQYRMNAMASFSPLLAADAETPSGLLAWLLGLERVDPTAPSVHFSWQYPLAEWVWVLIVAGAGVAAAFSYRHLLGRRAGRAAMATARAGLIVFVAMLIAGPMLVLPQTQREPDHVLMLVDQSQSLTVQDVAQAGGNARETRQSQLQALLASHGATWKALGERHKVDWFGFGEDLSVLEGVESLPAPSGRHTAMRTAIEQALGRTVGKPVSAVVVFSDGKSSESVDQEVWGRLNQLRVPVYTVALGSPNPPQNLALQVDAPDRAFVNDTVPVRVSVTGAAPDGRLLTSGDAPANTRVKLIDQATGQVLDEQPVRRFEDPVQLMTTPRAAGRGTWTIELVSDEPELIVTDNTATHEVTLEDRPIRVLYVEGYPRWEYRYLKNLLVREKSVSSSVMLISADRTFAQEGDVPLRRLPATPEEFDAYDVIIIGDVPATFFSAEQLRLMKDHVANNGAGLLWIGGEYEMPGSYAASLLADLLPMSSAESISRLPAPIAVKPTALAEALGVLRLRSPFGAVEEGFWPAELRPLMWAQSLGELKVAGEPLAVDEATGSPLVVRMRYGAGQSLYVATDEIWRWRYARGELYPEQFWMQLVRLLARGRLQLDDAVDARVRFSVSRRRATVGDTLVVELSIVDQTMLTRPPQSVQVSVSVVEGPDGSPVRAEVVRTLALTSTDRPGQYRGTWSPERAGTLSLKVTEQALADLGLERQVVVRRVDDEMLHPVTDHRLLEQLSQKTGGRVLAGQELEQLLTLVENRERTTAADVHETLWNTPLALVIALLLLTGEWIGRKMIGLV